LIELLVVIAIIGILSSIILASLNTARAKGADAAIESSLDQLRSQGEIYYDSNNNTYGGPSTAVNLCSGPTSTGGVPNSTGSVGFVGYGQQGYSILQYATSTAGSPAGQSTTAGTNQCWISSAAWAIEVPLKTTSSNSWCVDSNGDSKLEVSTPLTGTVCS